MVRGWVHGGELPWDATLRGRRLWAFAQVAAAAGSSWPDQPLAPVPAGGGSSAGGSGGGINAGEGGGETDDLHGCWKVRESGLGRAVEP